VNRAADRGMPVAGGLIGADRGSLIVIFRGKGCAIALQLSEGFENLTK
jgi:hypothetical protein